jgi:predicted transcriptional regulator
MIKSTQIRAGRELLVWSAADLARAAAVSKPTVDRAERTGASEDTVMRLRMALEKAGVVFGEGGGDGTGVRLSTDKHP